MTDKPYTNLDLEMAEAALIAAGNPEQAKAMRQYTEGWRNYIQGEFGQSFVDAFDRVMEKHIAPLSAQIGGLRGDTNALQAEFRSGLSGVQQTVSALGEAVSGLQHDVSDLERRTSASEKDRKDIRDRLTRLEAVNERLARIEAAMAERNGDAGR